MLQLRNAEKEPITHYFPLHEKMLYITGHYYYNYNYPRSATACDSFNSSNEINRKLKKITCIYFQKNPVSGHFALKIQLATQGKLEAIFC